MQLIKINLFGHVCSFCLENRQFLSDHRLLILLCSHLFHLISYLLDLILKLLNGAFELSVLQDHIGYLAVLGHDVHVLEPPPDPVIVVSDLHQHLLELGVLLLVDLQQVLLSLQVLLEFLDLVEVDLRDVLLLVLGVVDDLLHYEQARIRLVSLLSHPAQVRLKHLVLVRQLRYRVVKAARRGGRER